MRQQYKHTKRLLILSSIFFFAEFVLHYFGLDILEHDKIFLITHDLYIGSYALTIGSLLLLISKNLEKYRDLFFLTMSLIAIGIISGLIISLNGGYTELFPVVNLDSSLWILGAIIYLWYIATWACWYYKK